LKEIVHHSVAAVYVQTSDNLGDLLMVIKFFSYIKDVRPWS